MNEPAFLAILASSPVMILLIHAVGARLAQRFAPRAAPQTVAILAAAAAAPLVAGAAWRTHLAAASGPRLAVGWGYAAAVYGCLAYAYFHLFNLSETARRLRILFELHAVGAIDRAELERRYSPRALLDIRLERLTGTGQLSLESGRYHLTGRGLWLAARAVDAWRRALAFPR